jgi:hypothetical protein
MINDNSKFDRTYRKFYTVFLYLALSFFVLCGFGFWIQANKDKKEIFSWQFRGIVKDLHSIGHNIINVSINNQEYSLSHYQTGDKQQTGNNGYDFNSYIDNGDTLVKEKNEWDLKLIKQNGKVYIFKSDYNK